MQTKAVTISGENVLLCSERALFWPRKSLLVIADLHLGKDDVFRRSGIALPQGSTGHDLQRLESLVAAFEARGLLILGDILHGAMVSDAGWIALWQAWCRRHRNLERWGLLGNHDRALRGSGLPGLQLVGEDLLQSPFHFSHEPLSAAVPDAESAGAALHRICGHLHPVLKLHDGALRARLPCFWLGAAQTVLPAFTSLAGGQVIRPGPHEEVWICAGDELLRAPLPGYQTRSSGTWKRGSA